MLRLPLFIALIMLLGGGTALAKPPADARAVWLTPDRVAFKDGGNRTLALRTRAIAADGSEAAAGDHALVRAGVVDGDLARTNPHLAGQALYRVQDAVPAAVRDWLKGELTVVAGNRAVTGVQVGPVIDALYANDAALGVTFAGLAPTLRLWAPTATKVRLRLFDGPHGAESSVVDMSVDPATGVWQAAGKPAWNRRYYLYEVTVFVPAEGRMVTNLVTDPYSLNLSADSQRSQIVNLDDSDLKPDGWDALRRTLPSAPEDRAIYELHVRDFSIGDASVPRTHAGRYLGFADPSSVGMRHLAGLAQAGLSDVHLLPTFDCATIPEVPSHRVALPDLTRFGPANEMQQAAVTSVREKDGFNWCYDPWHFIAPEGSYSSDANTTARIVEFRRMVMALSGIGLGTILDQVFNHTTGVGQDRTSVFDRIVPGYYYRLDAAGAVTRSSCCPNTASERAMMEKLMVDALITWARGYKVSGFRFDLMGHHSRATMLKARDRLRALTLQNDGVDGANLYLYGEGWNFGEVVNDARFVQATQRHMGEATGIGTFNDRFRDAIRGGGVSDRGAAKAAAQGFANGLFTAPNASAKADAAARARLLALGDTIRIGLAGSLADYTLVTADGRTVKARDLRYGDGQVGYVSDPQETINYAEAHDNETLFDLNAFKLSLDTSPADRVRWQNMAASLVLLAQGVPFLHAGEELLRSKSLDRNSHDSGDWFNALDYSMRDNGFARGLPPFNNNQDDWPIDRKLLTNPRLRVGPSEIRAASHHVLEMLAIRHQTRAFRLHSAAEIEQRVHFPDAGPQQTPGVIVMTIDGAGGADVAVVFNVTAQAQSVALAGGGYALHSAQQRSSDPRLKEVVATGDGVTVPALTTAVFVRNRR